MWKETDQDGLATIPGNFTLYKDKGTLREFRLLGDQPVCPREDLALSIRCVLPLEEMLRRH